MALRPLPAMTLFSQSMFGPLILGLAVAFASCAQPESGTEEDRRHRPEPAKGAAPAVPPATGSTGDPVAARRTTGGAAR